MEKGKVEGLSLKQFAERLRRKKPRTEDKYFSSKDWHRKTTLDEQIIDFALSNHLSPEDFIAYFNENLKPTIEKKQQEQQEEHQRRQAEFEEKKRIENLPENFIPARYIGRKAYPDHFNKMTEERPLQEFMKVRDMTVNGSLDKKLGNQKTQFLSWINAIIDQKKPQTNETDTPTLLKKTISLFRGR